MRYCIVRVRLHRKSAMRTEIAGMESDLQHKNQASRNKRDGLKIYPRETIDKKVKERTQG
ncbi:BZ3500_MvSof-1268-A1-R1_Chr2-1g04393 [Microbotryum saponariae]|uniref:BZ3500_MvSof-1268-A1-R1_Chr2-1g04393 protein n=1 Tax=Microbotryum saponariae TaxID=289078 RepID=A0A2X0K6A1_9BASI|nr:BZ3500_MvSof-1268-A1-R1_Chr2-1g04393 [Microbotryum saponariae]SCZ91607.1 BZ3501_MvSof-1269-A2-R1_Chr2-1g04049 [Microbotryum saponariae]